MGRKLVAATEFQNHAGVYFDQAGKEPVVITKHGRPVRVLLDFDEFERLSAADARRVKLAKLAEEDHARFGPLYEKLAK